MTQLVRIQNFGLSGDGFGAGEGQSLERPFGHADPAKLMSWAGATAHWPNRTEPGGTYGLDDYCTRDFTNNIGAEIMGRNKFGPYRGPWENEDWQGWWGEEPPFHTPVFVLTHYERPALTLGETTFHFVDTSVHDALSLAFDAAEGKDVRIVGASPRCGRFWLPTSSTPCTSPSHRSNSVAVSACGRPPMSCWTDSISSKSPAPAGSFITSSGADER